MRVVSATVTHCLHKNIVNKKVPKLSKSMFQFFFYFAEIPKLTEIWPKKIKIKKMKTEYITMFPVGGPV